MLVDLFAPSNYVSYNIQIAEVLGLQTAVYISEIANINSKAIRKDKVEDNFFTLDREYLAKRTTLSVKEQEEIEKKLLSISVLEKSKDNTNMLQLNIDNLVALLTAEDKSVVADVKKLVKKKSTEEKRDGIRIAMQKAVKTTNPELRTAWYDWIDAVLEADKKINKTTVARNETLVDNFAQHNLDVALEVINWTTSRSYIDAQFAIDFYKERHPGVVKTLAPQVPLQRTIAVGNEEF